MLARPRKFYPDAVAQAPRSMDAMAGGGFARRQRRIIHKTDRLARNLRSMSRRFVNCVASLIVSSVAGTGGEPNPWVYARNSVSLAARRGLDSPSMPGILAIEIAKR